MYLHHINIGHPLLGPHTELQATIRGFRTRPGCEEDAEDDFFHFGKPELDYRPRVFAHNPVADSDGYAYAGLINESLETGPLAISLRYAIDSFPFFNQWKLLDYGDYIVGLEPNNAGILDRPDARRAGDLRVLEAGESVVYRNEIKVLDGPDEINEFRDKVRSVLNEG